ncbi:hypothetical protein [Mucilaginibacter xinganensis]|uniref:DUF5640 domain-containing protein n=1 Tax=Mucilaginibacter xinganensis TaxID=1234841 RepID=A0A223NTP0_9SPHI|nr:hypothetical protein [Mucilaginibacter xinganensis]ASU32871.1 hypothetical protein MuYL_0971 [Mucilaginibacter xinganensis]
MKKYALILIHLSCAFALFWAACTSNASNNKLQGKWQSKDGSTKLKITDKSFTMDDGEAIAEDYFIKGDTIFTSFEGNKPYTAFLIQKLDDHYLKLMGPDSVAIEFNK